MQTGMAHKTSRHSQRTARVESTTSRTGNSSPCKGPGQGCLEGEAEEAQEEEGEGGACCGRCRNQTCMQYHSVGVRGDLHHTAADIPVNSIPCTVAPAHSKDLERS